MSDNRTFDNILALDCLKAENRILKALIDSTLPPNVSSTPPPTGKPGPKVDTAKGQKLRALITRGYSVNAAARALGIPRATAHQIVKRMAPANI
jgi:transcriptional regulator of acetoin/glycerol metabolism